MMKHIKFINGARIKGNMNKKTGQTIDEFIAEMNFLSEYISKGDVIQLVKDIKEELILKQNKVFTKESSLYLCDMLINKIANA